MDDTHFKWVGLEDKDLFGYYITEEQGAMLKIFPTSKHLRYTIPWASVEEVMAYLRDEATDLGPKVAVMGDDGEKFGLWPGTYHHVWEQGWMEEFLLALEGNADWMETISPGDYARRFPAIGRVYLPTTSYDEMTEWALPAGPAGDIVALKHRLQDEGREDILRFIRGGFWRNFLVKYPEVNDLHKKMLHVHDKIYSLMMHNRKDTVQEATSLPPASYILDPLSYVQKLPPNLQDLVGQALDHLWGAQCNCPYWHGVFGGIYLPHIRTANYAHLIAAENLTDRFRHGKGAWVEVLERDINRDGHLELLIEGSAMNLYFDLHRGGTLFEWDWRAKRFNLLNNLTRRPEGYHKTLLEMERSRGEKVAPEGVEPEVKTIHDIVQAKEENLGEFLHYDWYRRTALIDHCLHSHTSLNDFHRAAYGEAGDFTNQPYFHEVEKEGDGTGLNLTLRRDGHVWCGEVFSPLRVEKRLQIKSEDTELPIVYTLTNVGSQPIKTRFGVEFNFGLLSGHTGDAFYHILGDGKLDDPHLDSRGEITGVTELALVHQGLSLEIRLAVDQPATLWRTPVETISSSESGFERGYQCSCILPHWEVQLRAGQSWQVRMKFTLINHEHRGAMDEFGVLPLRTI